MTLNSFFSFFMPKQPEIEQPESKLQDGQKIRLKIDKKVPVFDKDSPKILHYAIITPLDILTVIGSDKEFFFFLVAKNCTITSVVITGDIVGITKDSLICLDFEKIN